MTARRLVPALRVAVLAAALLAVVFAAPAQLPPSIDLVDIDNPPTGVLILKPEHPLDLAGELWTGGFHRSESKRAAFGDFDGDGLTDIAVGAPSNGRVDPNDRKGRAYIVFGRRNFQSLPAAQRRFNLIDSEPASGQADVVIRRHEAGDWLGYCVAAGDLNGDGYDDLVLAAPKADQLNFFPSGADDRLDGGVVYILFGSPHLRSPGGGVTEIDLTPVLGTVAYDPKNPCCLETPGNPCVGIGVERFTSLPPGVRAKAILGAYGGDQTGASVATGDIDNDGLADLVVGALSNDDGGSAADCWGTEHAGGILWVVFGDTTLDDDQVACPGQHAHAVDRKIDLRGPAVGPGQYSPCGTIETTGHALIAGRVGFKETFAVSVATGDLNGDGVADIIAGCPVADLGPANERYSTAYAFYGPHLRGQYLDLRDLPGTTQLPPSMLYGASLLHSEAGIASTGTSVTASDLNGDGIDDVVMGSPSGAAGTAFVVLSRLDEDGRPRKPGVPVTGGTILNVSSSADALGIEGQAVSGGSDQTGASTGTADVDGDGREDLLLGSTFAPRQGPASVRSGRLSAFYGATLPGGGQVLALDYDTDDDADPADIIVRSSTEFDHLGGAVSAVGDLDEDGFAEMAVVATGTENQTIQSRGYVAVVFGSGQIAGSGEALAATRPRYSQVDNPPATRFGPTIRATVNWESGAEIVFDPGPNPPATSSIGSAPSLDVFEVDREAAPSPLIPWLTLDNGTNHLAANTLWRFTTTRDVYLPTGSLGEAGIPATEESATAHFTFKYLDSELAGAQANESRFRLAVSIGGRPWQLIDSAPIASRNWIRTLAPIRVTAGTEYRFVIVTDLTAEELGEIFPEPPEGLGGE